MKILVIIPAYNEEKNILKTYDKVMKYKKKEKLDLDIVVINDGSKDKTEEICKKNNLNYITLINNLGIGGAVQTGYKYAYENGYDIAIQFDGDGQHNEKYIKEIIKPIEEGQANLVIGSRFIVKDFSKFKSTKSRRIGIKLISWLIKALTRKKITDPTSGFRACDKSIIKIFSNEYPAEYPEPESITYLIKSGYRVLEVPVEMDERQGGKSSIHSWKNVYYMVNVYLSIIITSIRRYNR